MSKKEIYDVLRSDGAKLKAMNFYTHEQLSNLYTERFGVEPDVSINESNDEPVEFAEIPEERFEKIRTLVFDRGGWCKVLKKSYAQGIYRPATVEEYAELRKYAAKEI